MHFLLFLVIDKIQELFLNAVTLKIYLYLAIYLKTTAIVFNNKIFPSNPLLAKVSASPLTTQREEKLQSVKVGISTDLCFFFFFFPLFLIHIPSYCC